MRLRAAAVAGLLASMLAACATDQVKKPPEKASFTKTGTVGYVSEIKDRGLTGGNWTDVVGGLFRNEYDRDVIRVRYEVTVLYDDHTQATVHLSEKPDLYAGQRVRVTGSKVEPLGR